MDFQSRVCDYIAIAILLSSVDVESYRRILLKNFPQKRCLAGLKPFENQLLSWTVFTPNAAALRSILHRFFYTGILNLWTEATQENLDDFTVSFAAETGHLSGADRTGNEIEQDDTSIEHWRIQPLLFLWLLAAILLPLTVCLGKLGWSTMSSMRHRYIMKLREKLGSVCWRAAKALSPKGFEDEKGIVLVSPQSLQPDDSNGTPSSKSGDATQASPD